MSKILWIGGIFVKSKNPETLKAWYKDYLWIDSGEMAAIFKWDTQAMNVPSWFSIWSVFEKDSDYFEPSQKEFMINFVVDNLEDLTADLTNRGVEILSQMDEPSGKFIHIMDPEGTKIELWEPAN